MRDGQKLVAYMLPHYLSIKGRPFVCLSYPRKTSMSWLSALLPLHDNKKHTNATQRKEKEIKKLKGG
jgi:hypothetical protein